MGSGGLSREKLSISMASNSAKCWESPSVYMACIDKQPCWLKSDTSRAAKRAAVPRSS